MEKKYRLTDETREWRGHTLYRVEALRSFGDVKQGELGGWVESEENLSHDDDYWVGGEAVVCDNAWVCNNAQVYGDSQVSGNAIVCNNAEVSGNVRVSDTAWVSGSAEVSGNAVVFGNAVVSGDSIVCDNAVVSGDSCVYDDAVVSDNARVSGNAKVYGKVKVCGDAVIKCDSDYIVFKNTWSSGRFFTWTKSNDMWKVGCFYGTGKELVEKAYKDSEISGNMYKTYVDFVENTLKKC